MADTRERPVLLYDAGCRFCRFAARVVALLDRSDELAYVSLRDPEAADLLPGLSEEERLATWRLAQLDGSLVGYGRGAVQLLQAMRLTRPAGRALAHVPPEALDRAYELVARSRGTLEHLVLDRPGPRRFP